MTEFEQDKMFVLSQVGGSYNVKYTFTPVGDGTELEYYEWMDEGELTELFTNEPLEKLKAILED